MSRTFSRDFYIEVRRGNIPGYSSIAKFGRNANIAAGATEEVWTPSSNRTRLTTAIAMEAISTDINDSGSGGVNPASTGAQVITIRGVDSNWNLAEEDVILDGTTVSSPTTTLFFRLYRAFVKQAGAYGGNNEGTITIRESGGGSTTQAQIATGKGQTEMAMYTVPINKTAYINTLWINSDASRVISCELYRYTGIDDVTDPYVGAKRKLWGQTAIATNAHVHHDIQDKIAISGPADIVFEATAAPGGAASVEAGFDLILVDN